MLPDLDLQRWHPDVIAGRRLVLRRHRPDHYETIARWYRDPEIARLTRFQLGAVSDDDVRRYFHTRVLALESFTYAIHVAGTERLIGTTSFSALDPDNASVLFHITIGERDTWSQGYGTETTELMVGHAFDGLRLHRVGLSVFAFNERAIRAYEKVGFSFEGRSREAVWRDGRFWDEIHMGILARDWQARPKAGKASGPAVPAGLDAP